MKSNSIGIKKVLGEELTKVWECGAGDQRLIGWESADGRRAIETNGDPVFEGEYGFNSLWDENSTQ